MKFKLKEFNMAVYDDEEMLMDLRNYVGITYNEVKKQFNSFDDEVKTEIRELYMKTRISYKSSMKGKETFSKYFKRKVKHSSVFIQELAKKLDNKYSAEDLKNIFKAEKDLIIEFANKGYSDIETPNTLYSIIRSNDMFVGLNVSPQLDFVKSIR